MSKLTKLIKISTKTEKLIEQYGKFGETYDEVLQRLLSEKGAVVKID